MRQTRRDVRSSGRTLPVEGFETPVEVRRHPAARRMTLRVSRTRRSVVVTVPVQCDLHAAGTFVNRHLDWVRDRLGSLPEPVPFRDGAEIPLRGQLHRLRMPGERRRGLVVQVVDRGAETPAIEVAGEHQHAPRRLGDWLIGQARADLDARVAVHAARLQVRPKRIAVRDQSSRWGSCSTTGLLSFSWRLVLAPPHVLDYVAAHEVAHLSEMNHGRRFWALVEETMPDMAEARRWLQRHGMELHRYG